MKYAETLTPVDEFLDSNPRIWEVLSEILYGSSDVAADALVDIYLQPMIGEIYKFLSEHVDAANMTQSAATFFVRELSVFARYNAQFLKRASESVSAFCPEFAHELMRNHLEEGGERGKIPAHSILYAAALARDVGVRISGYSPCNSSTSTLVWMHDVIVNSHCPSTILGMYYATEAVATPEIQELRRLTNRIGQLSGRGINGQLKNLDYWFRLHLDCEHEASYKGQAVETGHQEGIALFIRHNKTFNFTLPQVLDGFLQMLGPLTQQWRALKVDSKEM